MNSWWMAFGLNMAGAIVLRVVSKALEFKGDRLAEAEVPGNALFYHSAALLLLIGALIFFVRAGMAAYRGVFR